MVIDSNRYATLIHGQVHTEKIGAFLLRQSSNESRVQFENQTLKCSDSDQYKVLD